MNRIKTTILSICRLVKNRPAVILFVLISIIAMVGLSHVQRTELYNRTGQTFEKGVVTSIIEDNIQEDGARYGEQKVEVKMTSGVRKGEIIAMTSSSGLLFGTTCYEGLHVVVIQSVAGEDTVSAVYSRDRGTVLILFAALYLLALCLIGGRQGIRAGAGLVYTFGVILYIYVPIVYLGVSPVIGAVAICAVTTLATFYMIGGITDKTIVATIGTVAGVVIAGITAEVFSRLSGITGWNVSNIESLMSISEVADVQVSGLLFAGILISSLGAVMDVAMSISSSMKELVSHNPQISRVELMKSGMRVGRDMMGTDSNTLILAFAGSEVSVLVLNYAYNLPILQVLNSNNIGIAVMQGLSGSFGVVLCVPLTVLAAAYGYTRRNHLQDNIQKQIQ